MPNRKIPAQAQRLTIFIGESDRWRGKPLYAAILEILKAHGLAGATVLRGVAGFGAHSRIHTAAVLRLSEDLPLRIEVIDDAEHIAIALEQVSPMVREGLITVEKVGVVRYTHRYLNPLPADQSVSQTMTTEVVSLNPEQSVSEAWQTMFEHNLKALPVVDADRRLAGMLTSGDLLERAGLMARLSVARRLDEELLSDAHRVLQSSTLHVQDVLSAPVISARVDEPLGNAVSRLIQHDLKRLPVVDADDRLVGMLSRVDVLAQVADLPVQGRHAPPPSGGHVLADVMLQQIPAVLQTVNLTAMIDALLESGAHRLVVVDEQNQVVGLVSDGDLVARVGREQRRGVLDALLQRGKLPQSDLTAGQVMSSGVLSAPPDTLVTQAIQQLLRAGRKWMVVIDEQNHPIGLVDRQILLRALMG